MAIDTAPSLQMLIGQQVQSLSSAAVQDGSLSRDALCAAIGDAQARCRELGGVVTLTPEAALHSLEESVADGMQLARDSLQSEDPCQWMVERLLMQRPPMARRGLAVELMDQAAQSVCRHPLSPETRISLTQQSDEELAGKLAAALRPDAEELASAVIRSALDSGETDYCADLTAEENALLCASALYCCLCTDERFRGVRKKSAFAGAVAGCYAQAGQHMAGLLAQVQKEPGRELTAAEMYTIAAVSGTAGVAAFFLMMEGVYALAGTFACDTLLSMLGMIGVSLGGLFVAYVAAAGVVVGGFVLLSRCAEHLGGHAKHARLEAREVIEAEHLITVEDPPAETETPVQQPALIHAKQNDTV